MEFKYDNDGNIKLKIIFIGDSNTGKTNLINIIRNIEFNPFSPSTNIVSIKSVKMEINNKKINLYLFDMMGNERYKNLTQLYLSNAMIIILVYNITNKDSFDYLKGYWTQEIKDKVGNNIIISLLGNFNDLSEKKVVSDNEAKEYAKSIGAKWGLTSSKVERNKFLDYFKDIINEYIQLVENKEIENNISYESLFFLTKTTTIKKYTETESLANKFIQSHYDIIKKYLSY